MDAQLGQSGGVKIERRFDSLFQLDPQGLPAAVYTLEYRCEVLGDQVGTELK